MDRIKVYEKDFDILTFVNDPPWLDLNITHRFEKFTVFQYYGINLPGDDDDDDYDDGLPRVINGGAQGIYEKLNTFLNDKQDNPEIFDIEKDVKQLQVTGEIENIIDYILERFKKLKEVKDLKINITNLNEIFSGTSFTIVDILAKILFADNEINIPYDLGSIHSHKKNGGNLTTFLTNYKNNFLNNAKRNIKNGKRGC